MTQVGCHALNQVNKDVHEKNILNQVSLCIIMYMIRQDLNQRPPRSTYDPLSHWLCCKKQLIYKFGSLNVFRFHVEDKKGSSRSRLTLGFTLRFAWVLIAVVEPKHDPAYSGSTQNFVGSTTSPMKILKPTSTGLASKMRAKGRAPTKVHC